MFSHQLLLAPVTDDVKPDVYLLQVYVNNNVKSTQLMSVPYAHSLMISHQLLLLFLATVVTDIYKVQHDDTITSRFCVNDSKDVLFSSDELVTSISPIRIVNRSFLLLLSGDVERNPGPIKWKKLNEATSNDLDKILSKFGLITNSDASLKIKLNVLQCSVLYHKNFSKFNLPQILAGFGKQGKLLELKSEDESVKFGVNGIDLIPYPCAICAKEVDDTEGPTGEGLRCEGCWENFHNQCADTPMSKELYKLLMKSTPDFVKVYCQKCMISVGNYKQRIEDIAEELAEVKVTLDKIQEKALVNQDTTINIPPYKAAAMKSLEKKVIQTNSLVRNQLRRNDINLIEEEIERNKKIRIVRQPKDMNIRNSKDLRKQFNQYYPNVLLTQARISPGGSYLLEFDDIDSANRTQENWSLEHFEGNTGIIMYNKKNSAGIVKYVYDDISEAQITSEIEQNYPGAEFELFKTKENVFTGMIKVTFKDHEELDSVIASKFKILERKYIIEAFIKKPRVIKCNVCQRFGHISRLCRSKRDPVCGKCCKKHETKNCTSPQEDYKCYHCNKTDHITGSYVCEVMKEKLQELIDRQQNE